MIQKNHMIGVSSQGHLLEGEIFFMCVDILYIRHMLYINFGPYYSSHMIPIPSVLELGHPTKDFFFINPQKFTHKCIAVFSAVLYMGKKGVSKILFKVVAKKVLGRTIAKFLGDLEIALLINSIWDLVTVYLTMHTCKYIVTGPSFIYEAIDQLAETEGGWKHLQEAETVQMLRAIGRVVTANRSFHPNHYLMAMVINEKVNVVPLGSHSEADRRAIQERLKLDDKELFRDALVEMKERMDAHGNVAMHLAVCRTLVVLILACIVDGNYNASHKQILKEAFADAGVAFNYKMIERIAYDYSHSNNERIIPVLLHLVDPKLSGTFERMNCVENCKVQTKAIHTTTVFLAVVAAVLLLIFIPRE